MSSQTVDLSDRDFGRVAAFAYDRWGLRLPIQKKGMVVNRLTKLLRGSQFGDLTAFWQHVEANATAAELLTVFDALSTNLTRFFREPGQFDFLANQFLPEVARSPGAGKLRIWSAGCSSGCEAYTVSIVLHESLPNFARWDAKVLATDLAVTELRKAKNGVYPLETVSDVDPPMIERHFDVLRNGTAPVVSVKPHVRQPITFALLNLMEPWVMKGPFDVIFCRNVMIYFDEETRTRLVRRFTDLLRPGGMLFIGYSENLAGSHPDLERVQPSSYRKVGSGAPQGKGARR